MKIEPKQITASTFATFLSSTKICVIKAQAGGYLGFNSILKSQLIAEFKDSLNLGWIDTVKINYKARVIQEFVKVSIPNLGLESGGKILPGYYLFKNCFLVAFHPGTIEISKIEEDLENKDFIRAALRGLITGLKQKSFEEGFKVFLDEVERPVSLKVFNFFKEVLAGSSSSHSQQRQREVQNEELLNAYRLLQVSPYANDVEVKKAWRKLVVEHHPDRHPNDSQAKTRLCAELNHAYDLIKKSRTIKAEKVYS